MARFRCVGGSPTYRIGLRCGTTNFTLNNNNNNGVKIMCKTSLKDILKHNEIQIIKHVEIPQRNGGVVELCTATIDGQHKIVILSGMDKNNELTTMILAGDNKEGNNEEL